MIVKGIHYNDSVKSHCQVFSLTLVKIIGCLGKTLFNSTINDRGNMNSLVVQASSKRHRLIKGLLGGYMLVVGYILSKTYPILCGVLGALIVTSFI